MKTDVDLLTEFFRWLFCEALDVDPAKGSLIFSEWKRQWLPLMQQKAAKAMGDAEYKATLEKMKSEAPAFLHHLRTSNFPDLPPDLKPFPKS